MRKLVTLLLCVLLLPFAACASESNRVQVEVSSARIISEVMQFAPREPFWVALELTHKTGWHSYTEPPGDAGIATTMEWQLPPGFTASGIFWPPAQPHIEGTITTYGYENYALLPVKITPPTDVKLGQPNNIVVRADWLTCNEICIPESATLTLTMSASAASVPSAFADTIRNAVKTAKPPAGIGIQLPTPGASPKVDESPESLSFVAALLFALLGGLVLNLMPCVFPVLSLKSLAVAKKGSISRHEAIMEGLAYTAGILVCFAAVAGMLILLQQSGAEVGWGFQMQSPAFVTFMALLLFIIGLNLSGFFSLPVLFGSVGLSITREPTLSGSFLTGVLATLVATPCTAPFMASAVGFALTQSPAHAMMVFLALGLGLALPFLLISVFPRLLAKLPKPGAWMDTMKELLAFPMYLSSVWLLWVLAQQASPNAVGIVLTVMTGLVFILWAKRFFPIDSRFFHRVATLLIVLLTATTVIGVERMPGAASRSALLHYGVPFSAADLKALRDANKPVFVDVTAAWCITCQVNFHSTLSTDVVKKAFEENGITFMVADWTRTDPEITEFLSGFGYRGVPLYVYFPPEGSPRVLPQLLTPRIVIETINAE